MSTKRRKNLNRRPIGSHWTLTRVVVNDSGTFGFALGDDGKAQAYLPRSIIEQYDLTSDDEGGGFHAPLKPNSERPGENPWIMSPLIWDDDAETGDEVEELLAQMDNLPQILANIDKVVAVLQFTRGEMEAKVKWMKEHYDAV